MQFSNTSQYAIRILSYMAIQQDSSMLNATELSQELSISYKFLTKIMTILVKANFIKSIRGREGGFTLEKCPSKIKINDILKLFNDSIDNRQCVLGIGACDDKCKCAMHDKWMKPKLLMQKLFLDLSIEDIAQKGCKH